MELIERSEGRRLFGADPAGYDRGRPDYPDWIFDSLVAAGALYAGANTLEIGPGSGLATRHLLERGASPITLIEPDERLGERLRQALAGADAAGSVLESSFETAALPEAHFDLVAAATAFHWIDPAAGLTKIRHILKPEGTAALFW
ncbi:MAG: class I SAM-dependent methyltransferase, partial [Gammaproteobacteria bacterium]